MYKTELTSQELRLIEAQVSIEYAAADGWEPVTYDTYDEDAGWSFKAVANDGTETYYFFRHIATGKMYRQNQSKRIFKYTFEYDMAQRAAKAAEAEKAAQRVDSTQEVNGNFEQVSEKVTATRNPSKGIHIQLERYSPFHRSCTVRVIAPDLTTFHATLVKLDCEHPQTVNEMKARGDIT